MLDDFACYLTKLRVGVVAIYESRCTSVGAEAVHLRAPPGLHNLWTHSGDGRQAVGVDSARSLAARMSWRPPLSCTVLLSWCAGSTPDRLFVK